ncbi:hypothetical protein [Gallaecimonas sp. GXIMD1310]|uniref:hypothetical protein n=1 Tax=Gallaecimonas sp. GXIMD1310 TaxID=3131926 RepID=UPI00324CC8F9
MKAVILTVLIFLPGSWAFAATAPLAHFDDYCSAKTAQSSRCHDYLIGVIDGVKMQYQSESVSEREAGLSERALRQRVGGRLDYIKQRLCDRTQPKNAALLQELRQEVASEGISSGQELLVYLNNVFSCR